MGHCTEVKLCGMCGGASCAWVFCGVPCECMCMCTCNKLIGVSLHMHVDSCVSLSLQGVVYVVAVLSGVWWCVV